MRGDRECSNALYVCIVLLATMNFAAVHAPAAPHVIQSLAAEAAVGAHAFPASSFVV